MGVIVRVFYGAIFVATAAALIACAGSTIGRGAPPINVKKIPIGLAYAGDGVNAEIFRVNAIASAGGFQFVTFYDSQGRVVVGRRDLNATQWDLAVQKFSGRIGDAHNVVVLGISSDGYLHLAYDHHATVLNYRASGKPFDIHSFGQRLEMTGRDEAHVTYPQFLSSPDGSLYFFYRDGVSGAGSLCVNVYVPSSKSWRALHHPLIDGQNKCNPYWWRPAFGADGSIHLAWCWRDTPDASTNHDLCYACSKDGGEHWLRSNGMPQPLPITPENAEVVIPIPNGSNLINQCSSAVDHNGHPHLAEFMNDKDGIPQYFDIWFDGSKWNQSQVSHRTVKFSLGGRGSLSIPMSRPEIAVSRSGIVSLITRDADVGGGIRLYRSAEPFLHWTITDITQDDLGNWDPVYDLTGYRESKVLSLFVLHVEQGNHETTSHLAAQEASVLQIPLP